MIFDLGEVKRIAVLGAGTISFSWTAWFLAQGYDIDACDPDGDTELALRDYVAQAWPALEKLGLRPGASIARLRYHADPRDAVRNAQFVQESVSENVEATRALYAAIEPAMLPRAILASSAGMMKMTDLQGHLASPGRFIVAHPFNPPHLIPLVEIVPGAQTDRSVVDFCMAFYRQVGKRPIEIRKEVPGILANRLQAALFQEAVSCVVDGVASVEDVDIAVSQGLGLRWAIMGPFMNYHLMGGMAAMLEQMGPVNEQWWQTLGRPTLNPDVRNLLTEGVIEESRGQAISAMAQRRDALLVDLLQTVGDRRPGQ